MPECARPAHAGTTHVSFTAGMARSHMVASVACVWPWCGAVWMVRTRAASGSHDDLRFISSENEDSECERVVNEIIDMRLKRRCKYSNFAILYRGNYQAKLVEIKLQAQNIPYEITGGQSFYAKTEIKDVDDRLSSIDGYSSSITHHP